MDYVLSVLIIASWLWVYFDASTLCAERDLSMRVTTRWTMGCILLWIVFFPMYLAHRRDEERFKANWFFLKPVNLSRQSLFPSRPTGPPSASRKCPQCGYPNPPGWVSCYKCGHQSATTPFVQ